MGERASEQANKLMDEAPTDIEEHTDCAIVNAKASVAKLHGRETKGKRCGVLRLRAVFLLWWWVVVVAMVVVVMAVTVVILCV